MLKCFVICFISLPGARAQLPNIVSITADDWGWAAFSPHRAVPTPEVVTPRLAALAAEGILLDRSSPAPKPPLEARAGTLTIYPTLPSRARPLRLHVLQSFPKRVPFWTQPNPG